MLHLDHFVRRGDERNRQVVLLGRKAAEKLKRMNRRDHRHRRIAELAKDRVLEIGVAVALAHAPAVARHRHRSHHHQIDLRQLIEREILAPLAAALERGGFGGIFAGSSLRKAPFNRGVGVITVMPRSSASFLTQRCGESGLTLMIFTPRKTRCASRRAAACSAPLKFGMRP